MARTLVLPDVVPMVRDLARRVGILERRTIDRGADTRREIVFTLPGALIGSTSPKYYVRDGGLVTSVLCSLGTAGSTSTTVQIKRDGVVVRTITLAAGVTVARAVPQVPLGADQEALTVTVSAAGTGARDLTVQVRFS